MNIALKTLAVASIAAFAFAAIPVLADEFKYTAMLTGAVQTPAGAINGTGTLDATYDTDTKTLTWTITYEGLSGPVTAAHFHGPAKEGEDADPVVPLLDPLASPINGSAALTDDQYKDLSSGLWYLNLHTEKYPDGEIRGQVTQVIPNAG